MPIIYYIVCMLKFSFFYVIFSKSLNSQLIVFKPFRSYLERFIRVFFIFYFLYEDRDAAACGGCCGCCGAGFEELFERLDVLGGAATTSSSS